MAVEKYTSIWWELQPADNDVANAITQMYKQQLETHLNLLLEDGIQTDDVMELIFDETLREIKKEWPSFVTLETEMVLRDELRWKFQQPEWELK